MKFPRVLSAGVRIPCAPRIRIVRHRVGAYPLLFVGAFCRPLRIVKLIGHTKSANAAHGCSTLLKGEEAAIGLSQTTIAGCRYHDVEIVSDQLVYSRIVRIPFRQHLQLERRRVDRTGRSNASCRLSQSMKLSSSSFIPILPQVGNVRRGKRSSEQRSCDRQQ